MAISTYAELKTAIGTWLHRSDLSTVATDFVNLAEKRIFRDIIEKGGLRILESSTTLTPSGGACTLPNDFIGVRSMVLSSSPNIEVSYVPLDRFKQYSDGSGKVYCISGTSILLSPDADDYSLTLYYYAKPSDLSDSNTSNTLFANSPDIYLYACLIEASVYVNADHSRWTSAYQEAIDSLIKQDRMQRWGNGLRVRAA